MVDRLSKSLIKQVVIKMDIMESWWTHGGHMVDRSENNLILSTMITVFL